MAAAAVPIATSLAAPALADVAGTALAGTALGTLATSAPWLLPAITGAGLGGIGSMLTGGDPLKGALFGGIGGGIGSQIDLGKGLGTLFGGGINPSAGEVSGALSSAAPSGFTNAPDINIGSLTRSFDVGSAISPGSAVSGAATSAASNSPSFLSKIAGPALLSGGAMLLDRSMAPTQVGPAPHDFPESKPVAALTRQQQTVDPASYYTAGGNRNFYNPYSLQPQYLAKGGRPMGLGNIRRFDDGGSASNGRSTMPGRMRGAGNGQSDSIPAMLSDGEFVISAPAVSALGGGSNDAGARKLDKMQKNIIRKHYSGGKPRKAMGLGAYMH